MDVVPESKESNNEGNFRVLEAFRVDADRKVLGDHLAKCPNNATYMSKATQNEICNIIGDEIRQEIISDILRSGGDFSVLCDEGTDSPNLKQISIVLHYVNQDGDIQEDFMDFGSSERITGEELVKHLLQRISDWGLDMAKCKGQNYDGASSECEGVQTEIWEKWSKAVYVHCNSHVLNLSIVKACLLASIRNMAGTVSEVSLFFSNFVKRQQACFEKVLLGPTEGLRHPVTIIQHHLTHRPCMFTTTINHPCIVGYTGVKPRTSQ